MRLCLLVIVIFLPSFAHASIQISEVAWMGGPDSANHEWIELHNTGTTVSVDGWILHDANNLTIAINGTLTSGQRAVLERTSDASAPGSAFLLYTGALGNTGATLVLRDSTGVVVDQVNGGSDWENIGGNNETKETAQLRNGQWVTEVATPGSAPTVNTDVADTDPQTDTKTVQAQTSSQTVPARGGTKATKLVLPDISLQLAIDAAANVHVGQTMTLAVEPSGVGKTIADSLVYQWSLGNGEQRAGKEIEYVFGYPGQYVVVVSGEYKRQKQFARQTVVVLSVELQLTKSADGTSHVLHNQGTTEINVGNYRLVGTSEHVFPIHTIILPQSEIHIPIVVTNHNQAVVALYDPVGQAVAMHVPGFVPTAGTQPLVSGGATRAAATPPLTQSTTTTPTNFGFVSDVPTAPAPIVSNDPPQLIPVALAAETDTPPSPPTAKPDWPLYGLIALLVLGTASIYVVPRKSDSPPWV
jgi:hypothetical protein